MQLDLNDQEIAALRGVVQSRIDELLMEIANTDSRDYREELKSLEAVLQAVFGKLGCYHSAGTADTVCTLNP